MPHNSRRSFFKKFGVLIGAASLSPTLFIPKFEPVKWKVMSEPVRWLIVPNPEYFVAKYEWGIMTAQGLADVGWPVRWNEYGVDGKPISIPPFMMQRLHSSKPDICHLA
jgi:hypothetical protein